MAVGLNFYLIAIHDVCKLVECIFEGCEFKGLYFSSEVDVLFDANVMGCNCVTSFPPGRADLILCARMPVKVSLLPSVVRMNGVPLYTGAGSTGSVMSCEI